MRFIVTISLLSLAATFAFAQNNIPQVKHVIVVIQENRTPDNLFGSDAFAQTRQLPGADLAQLGKCGNVEVQLQSLNLGNACDPNHLHQAAWVPTYDKGNMDGACNISASNCTSIEPEYSYVQSSNVVPYFQIAQQYGYANYFFQTNQGPSFSAHQFLFTGSSAPTNFADPTTCYDPITKTSTPCYEWFAAELLTSGKGYGCATQNTVIPDIDPAGNEANAYNNGFPCYNHNSLATLLDANNISWKYYTQSGPNSLWTGPNAIQAICYPLTGNKQECGGYDWTHYVASVFPNSPAYPNSFSPILTDLGADPNQQQCALPAVSWVVPDGNWSDHAGLDPDGSGPAWVAAIVDAVGGYNNTGGQNPISCYDMINGKKVPYWQDTVILVTWDDWGGWYDHILPWQCNNVGVCSGYPGGPDGGGSEYVYGFRVPLLVVSAYNYRPAGSTGYISGACGQPGQPACPNEQQKYIHDFGSILNFIEYAFGTGGQPLHVTGYPAESGISPLYPYADVFAPDGPTVCTTCTYPYSLSDFFNFNSGPTAFTPFTQGINYRTQCFLTPSVEDCFGASFTPADPDDDAVD